MKGDTIIIKPFHGDSGSEFAEFILADLLSEGYSGETLLSEFKVRSNVLRGAVKTMISKADLAAAGASESESLTDVFGAEE